MESERLTRGIEDKTLREIRPPDKARVVRRIVDNGERAPRLDVAAFNSAP